MIENAPNSAESQNATADYADRLALAMKQANMSTSGLAAELKLSYQAVKRILDGKSKSFSAINNEKAAIALNVSAYWLASGVGTMKKNNVSAQQTPVYSDSHRKIWVIGKGSGGLMPDRIWDNNGALEVEATEYAEVASSDKLAFLSEVVGNSMFPKFENKNYVLVEPSTSIDLEDCVLVRLNTGETMIKRLLSRRDGIKLGSYNDPAVLHFDDHEVTWMYYIAHEVPRKKIKTRYN